MCVAKIFNLPKNDPRQEVSHVCKRAFADLGILLLRRKPQHAICQSRHLRRAVHPPCPTNANDLWRPQQFLTARLAAFNLNIANVFRVCRLTTQCKTQQQQQQQQLPLVNSFSNTLKPPMEGQVPSSGGGLVQIHPLHVFVFLLYVCIIKLSNKNHVLEL